MLNLRDSHILNHKQNLEWNWLLIATILKVKLFSLSTTDSLSHKLLFHTVPIFSCLMFKCFFPLPVAKRKPQEQQR